MSHRFYFSLDGLKHSDGVDRDEFEEVVDLIPTTVEEFEQEYDGESEQLIEDLESEIEETDIDRYWSIESGLFASASALQVVSRGGEPEVVQELYNKLDEAGMLNKGNVRMGEQVSQPVEVLGGEDWTKLTYSFYDFMSLNDDTVEMIPRVDAAPLAENALEGMFSVSSIGQLSRFIEMAIVEEVSREHLEGLEYFELDVREEDVTERKGSVLAGDLKVPSPYTLEDGINPEYDHHAALRTLDAYGDAVEAIQAVGEEADRIREGYRQDIREIARSI